MSPRVGARVGPFYASTNARGCGPFLGFIFFGALLIGFPIAYPAIGIPIYVAVIGIVVWLVVQGRRRNGARVRQVPAVRVEARLAEIEALRRLHREGRISDETFEREVADLERAVDEEFGGVSDPPSNVTSRHD